MTDSEPKVKVTGQRQLEVYEIELINELLEAEKALLAVHARVVGLLESQSTKKRMAAQRIFATHRRNEEQSELERFEEANPFAWASRGMASVQMGVMSMVRAIEQPG